MKPNTLLTALAAVSLFPIPGALAAIPDNWEAKYDWHAEDSTSGPVLIVVDLDAQEALVYRNGVEIGKTPVSTGRKGHRTPTGIFQILNKDADHHSSTYNNASKLADLLKANVVLPDGFGDRVHPLITPGTLIVTTPEEVTAETRSAGDFHVLNAGKPGAPAADKKE